MQNNGFRIQGFFGQYRYLSNFWDCDVEYEGLKYKSSEAAFQAAKCKNNNDRIQFTSMEAKESKAAGKHVKLRSDWEEIKVGVMLEIVRAKFTQNPKLAQALKQTQFAKLIESNKWCDNFWGVCECDICDGVGQNMLGEILMTVRDELLKK